MSSLEVLIQAFLHAVIYGLVVICLNFKYIQRDIKTSTILLICFFTTISMVKMIVPINDLHLPIIAIMLVFTTYVIYRLSFPESLLLITFGIFLILNGELCCKILFTNILKVDLLKRNSTLNVIIVNLFILFIEVIIASLRRILRTSWSKSKISLKFIFTVCIMFIAIITTLNYRYFSQVNFESTFIVNVFNLTTSTIYFLLFVFLITSYISSRNQRILLEQQTSEHKQLIEYMEVMEGLYEDIRCQRHDFLNMLLPIKGYIDNNQLDELKTYYYDNVLRELAEESRPSHLLPFINNIKHVGLKGLLTYKLNHAVSTGIKIYVNIFSEINIVGISSTDICRIIGILIDNALEASAESSAKEVHVGLESEDRTVSVIISNSYLQEPNLSQLFKRGYSIKGKGRGLGLYILKNILSQYPFIHIRTAIENNMFFQELTIQEQPQLR